MVHEFTPNCPQCGLPVFAVPEEPNLRCRSCAVLVHPGAPVGPVAAPNRASGYVIAVLVSTVICLLLIVGLVVVTGVMLLRGG